MGRIYEDNSLSIGNTPLVKLNRISAGLPATIVTKIEGRNPSYSVKCRIGAAMIWDAERKGILKRGSNSVTIIEPTSGNTGIALAFVAASRGYSLVLTMPETMSLERRRLLKAFGAELILPEGAKGMPARLPKRKRLRHPIPRNTGYPSSSRIRLILRFILLLRDLRSGMTPMGKQTFSFLELGLAERSQESADTSNKPKTNRYGALRLNRQNLRCSQLLSMANRPNPDRIKFRGLARDSSLMFSISVLWTKCRESQVKRRLKQRIASTKKKAFRQESPPEPQLPLPSKSLRGRKTKAN